MKTAIISDEAGLSALEGEWTQLFEQCKRLTPFQSFAWNYSWWIYHRNCGSLTVITVRQNGQLVGLGPFFVRRSCGVQLILPIGGESFAYYVPLVPLGRDDIAQAIAVEIAARFHRGLIHVPYYQTRDEVWSVICACLSTLGWNSRCWVRNVCHCLFETDGYAAFMGHKSSKVRYNIKRERKKLEETGSVAVQLYQGSELDEVVVKRLAAIQSRSWLARRGQETLGSPYYQELLPRLGRAFLADVYILTVAGNDVAFVLNYHLEHENICINIGFDEAIEHLSPGKVLMNCVVQTILNRNDLVLDFFCGEGEYKRFWGNRSKYAMEIVLWKGSASYLHSWFPARLRQIIKQFPRIKNPLKKVRHWLG